MLRQQLHDALGVRTEISGWVEVVHVGGCHLFSGFGPASADQQLKADIQSPYEEILQKIPQR